MSGTLGTATLETEVDLDGLDSGLNTAEGNTKGRLSSMAGSVSTLLGDIVVGAAALAVGAVAAIGVTAIDVSAQFSTATNAIQTQLGLSEQDAEEFGQVIEDVWGNNFGGSVEEVGAAVATVTQQIANFGDLTHDEIAAATEDAFRLSDAFGIDVAESTNAVGALMENFGLTADEAFDFVTAGMQRGLNTSDDFLETITEYSTQFGNAGADAGQFFSLLDSGLASGMLGTDKAADAFKEFNVRILDGSDMTRDALGLLGLSIDDITEGINDGSITQADAFQLVIDALGEQEDAALQYQAGVGLLGTQFEDLGVDAVLALNLMGGQLDNVAGSTDSLNAQYDNWPTMWEGIKRTVLLAIKPIGDALLNIANMVMPYVTQALGWFETNLAPALTDIATKIQFFADTFFGAIEDGATPLEAFKTALATIIPQETIDKVSAFVGDVRSFIDKIVTFANENADTITDVIMGVGIAFGSFAIISTVVGWIGGLVAAFGTVSAAITGAGGVIGAIVLALGGPLTIAIAGIAALIGLLTVAWVNNWGDIQGKTEIAIANITAAVESFKAMWAVFIPWFNTNVTQVWAGNIDNMVVIWTLGKQNITDLVDNFKITWAALMAWFDTDVVQVWSGNIDSFVTVWATAKDIIEADVESTKLTFESAFDSINTLFDNFESGIGACITAMGNFITWVGNVATAVANFDLGALSALLSQSPPPLAVGIKWVGGEMDAFTKGPLTLLRRGVDDMPGLSANRLQPAAMDAFGARPLAFDRPVNGQGGGNTTFHFDLRGSVISSQAQMEQWIDAALLKKGVQADTYIRTR